MTDQHDFGMIAMAVMGRNLGRKNGYRGKHKQQCKTDNGRRVSKNPIERKSEFTQSGMLFGH